MLALKVPRFAPWAAATFLLPAWAHASTFDVGWFVSYAEGWGTSPAVAWVLGVALLGANFTLNGMFLGRPAERVLANGPSGPSRPAGNAPQRRPVVPAELLFFTLLSVGVDRVAWTLAAVLGVGIAPHVFGWDGAEGVHTGLMLGVGLDLVLSAVGVGLLARHFLVKRWGVPSPEAGQLALRAAIWANPAWVIRVAKGWV